jgi:Fungal specific transcription factor domain
MLNASPDDMQNRIDRLEGLVLSLMTNGSQSAGPTAAAGAMSAGAESMSSGSLGRNLDAEVEEPQMLDDVQEYGEAEDSDTEKVTKSFGIMKVDPDNNKTFYIGEAHWAALLNDISEVRNYWQTHKKQYEEQMQKVAKTRKGTTDDSGPALLFGASKPPSREEIMSHIPSRYTCDTLIARYFNTFDPATHILHGPTFQKQYNKHWQDPSKTSVVWVAMLFSMMRLAMLSWARDGDEPSEFQGKCTDLVMLYRTQMAHCLILADYTKPHAHLIETLIFHLHGEYTSNRDAESSVWVLVGMIARLAMRMGYHRDSKYFPNITPFQGEMRRRIWTFVRQSDLLFSFQIALPSMIRLGDSDTELPRNIYDEEFNEDSPALPPPRPASEATPVSYMIAKARLAFGFGRVMEEVNGVTRKPYDEILKIDRGLRDIYASTPEHLRLRPMAEQTLAPISLIMARFGLASVYHKSLCVLHRRFLKAAKTNSRYHYSRQTCIDSAMTLLNFQDIQYRETGDRGRMRSMRAYINSLTTHDFLLAATILCMDLYHNREGPNEADTPSTSISGGSGSRGSTSADAPYGPHGEHNREDIFKMLERSRDIWQEQNDLSMEAFKASELLSMLLQELKLPYGKSPGQLQAQQDPFPNTNGNGSMDEQNAAMTLGLLSSGGHSPNPQTSNVNQQQGNLGGGFDSIFANNLAQDQPYGGVFGAQSATFAPNPFNSMFGNGLADSGGQMNLDWVSLLPSPTLS